jgi:dephospho-CoA kinase
MLKVGLTGGIGSGKSTVAAVFGTLGIPVANADQEARRLMNEDPGLREAIIRHFGDDAYSGGTLNRKYLAERVFSDPVRLELLNSLVHPVTIREGEQWVRSLEDRYPYVIREAALLFETRAAAQLDFIIGVSAPLSLRIQRAMHRDRSPREAIVRRMHNQIDEDIKMRLCDAIVRNDEREPLIPQVLELHERLLLISASRAPL